MARLACVLLVTLAAGCGQDSKAVTVRWDREAIVLPARDGCACGFVEFKRNGQIDLGLCLSLALVDGGTGAPTSSQGVTSGACASSPLLEGQFYGWAYACGQGVAGTWRLRATAIECNPGQAPRSTGVSADVAVVVP